MGSCVRKCVVYESSHRTGNGTGIEQRYEVGNSLGSGTAKLIICRETGAERVLKIVKKESLSKWNELATVKNSPHMNIVRLFELAEDECSFYIVSEYIFNGELFDNVIRTQSLSEQSAANVFRQILSALSYAHSLGLCHSHLKPENILLDTDNTVKISDFGTPASQCFPTDSLPYYMAPELLNSAPTVKCDIWSCGVLLYLLLSGTIPYHSIHDKSTLKRLKRNEHSFKGRAWDRVSGKAKCFLKKLLEFDPKFRISASEAIQDEWIILNTSESQDALVLLDTEGLAAFSTEQKMQHAIDSYLATQFLTKQESLSLLETFKQIDRDSDGKIDESDLIKVYKQFSIRDTELQRVLNEVDSDHTGRIDYRKFVRSYSQKTLLKSKTLMDYAFKQVHVDGKILVHDINKVLGKDHEVILHTVTDTRESEELELSEFIAVVAQRLEDAC